MTLAALLCPAAAALSACDGSAPPPPPASRVQAVAAKAPDTDALAGFCDVRGAASDAPVEWPALAGGARLDVSGGPAWINLWATWCKPCLEELPMIAQWRSEWEGRGAPTKVVFVSVDRTEADLTDFASAHPGTPNSLRLADPEVLAEWMRGAGLGQAAGLPIHVFTDAAGRARCVRAGAVTDAHRPLVELLLR